MNPEEQLRAELDQPRSEFEVFQGHVKRGRDGVWTVTHRHYKRRYALLDDVIKAMKSIAELDDWEEAP